MNDRTISDMTTAEVVDWGRAKDIFLDALDLPATERRAYLDTSCASDPSLRSAVLGLISSHEHATDFLVLAEPIGADSPKPTPALPRQIGPYEPIERLGEGGHGTVYRARQHAPVQRDVALKVLKPGLESADLIARFADERRFLARMDHPDIVKIYDAGGTPDGRLFVAMEVVEGLPITEFAEQHALTTRGRIALVARLCRAVQHAHQRAVMHRDLKPSNILVSDSDDGPRLRIIDFGIARALADDDNPDHTKTLRAMGTPRYMSPEQAGSGFPVDTRTDIYAIGIILCELLTGKTPRPPATGDRSATKPTAAVPPSSLASETAAQGRATNELKGDLDRIVLKAVAWEPDLRYASAAALADDLDRYLRGDPVSATPPSKLYIARKFASRHKAGVILSSAAALAVTGGLVLALLGRSEAIRQQHAAEASNREAIRQADRTEFVTTFFLEDMLAAADPDASPGHEISVREVLDTAAARAGDHFAGDPSLLASIRGTLGIAFAKLGRDAEAEATLAEAIALATSARESDSGDAPLAEDVLRWRYHRARSLLLLPGRHKDAGRTFESAAADARRELGPDHPLTLRIRLNASEYIEDQALRSEEVIAIERATRAPDFNDPPLRMNALRYAAQAQQRGSTDTFDTIAGFREAHAIALRTLGPDHTQTIKLRFRLAEALITEHQGGEGLPLLTDALERAETVYGENNATLTGMQRLAVKLYIAGGEPDEAVRIARVFADASAAAFGVDSIPHVSAGQEIARAMLEAGKPTEALAEFQRILPLRIEQWGAAHAQTAMTWRGLADTHLALDEWDACIDASDHAMSILSTSSPTYYRVGITRATALAAAGLDAAGAIRALRTQATDAGAPQQIFDLIEETDRAISGTQSPTSD